MLRILNVWLALAAAALAQKVEFAVLPEGTLEERLRLADPKVAVRFARLRTMFEESKACTELVEQKVPGSKEPNLICRVGQPDPGVKRIVVGAHFDSAGGDGVIDNWTGAILLPTLARFASERPGKHAFEFVGFAAEERGLWGSKEYVRKLGKEGKAQIAAVIAMDALGLTPVKCWPNSSAPELMRAAMAIAQALKIDFQGVNVDEVGSTDSMTFHKAGIPTLSLHSITAETWPLINSSKDVWKSLSWRDYYDTHRFVSALLVYLDGKLP